MMKVAARPNPTTIPHHHRLPRFPQSPGFISYARKCDQLGIERALRQQHVHTVAEQEREVATESEEGEEDAAVSEQDGKIKEEGGPRSEAGRPRELVAGLGTSVSHRHPWPAPAGADLPQAARVAVARSNLDMLFGAPVSNGIADNARVKLEGQGAPLAAVAAGSAKLADASRVQVARSALDHALALQNTAAGENAAKVAGESDEVAARRRALDHALDAQLFGN
jgi:hypothetical protein